MKILQENLSKKIVIFSEKFKNDILCNRMKNELPPDYFRRKVRLYSGQTKHIENLQNDFKNGRINIILLDKSISYSGANLECGEILIITSKSDKLEQLKGRCLRPGRSSKLTVYEIYPHN